MTSRIVAGVVGTAGAGLIVGLAGKVAPVFVIDAFTFAFSAFLMSRLRLSGNPPGADEEHHFWSQLGHGLVLLRGSRPLRGVLVGATVVMLGLGAVNVLLVPFVVGTLQVSESWFGALEAAQVSSMVMAGVLVTVLAKRLRPAAMVVLGLGGVGVVVGGIAAVQSVWHLMAALFLVGWFIAPAQAGISTIFQTEAPRELLGRASSSLSTAVTAANISSMAAAGAAAALIGVRGVFLAGGALTVLAALLAGFLFRQPKTQVAVG
jgi:MFS transporter, DHA3 family, macrolide efflux protein